MSSLLLIFGLCMARMILFVATAVVVGFFFGVAEDDVDAFNEDDSKMLFRLGFERNNAFPCCR